MKKKRGKIFAKVADHIQTRWGLCAEQYFKSRIRWMTPKEMADELQIDYPYVYKLFAKNHINFRRKWWS